MIKLFQTSTKWKIVGALVIAILIGVGIFLVAPLTGSDGTAEACGVYGRDPCWWRWLIK
jgi:hypothetical protein